MKEKERGGKRKGEKIRQKKRSEKKKVPMRESNPRPLNLQTLKSVAIVSSCMHIYDQTSFIYIANLDCHDLNVSALAPPISDIFHLRLGPSVGGD